MADSQRFDPLREITPIGVSAGIEGSARLIRSVVSVGK